MVKFIFITGGSLSGLGKGTCASSIGVVLKTQNLSVTAIKIDPYLNCDAGTMAPSEHGEVFVLQDGYEADLDLGNYERALDLPLTHQHNITTGKIYLKITAAERAGKYLGQTVQLVPHVTDCVAEWIMKVGAAPVGSTDPEVCIVELGGTVGDMESAVYLETLQRLFLKLDPTDYCLAHLTFVPVVGKEQKTKCAQHSFLALREAGLRPDFIFGRCETPLTHKTREKLASFSGVKAHHVFCLPNLSSLYYLPTALIKQNFGAALLEKWALKSSKTPLVGTLDAAGQWERVAERLQKLKSEAPIKVGIVAKYIHNNDTYLSIIKALEHAACEAWVHVEIVWIDAEHLVDPAVIDEADALSVLTVPQGCHGSHTLGAAKNLAAERQKNIQTQTDKLHDLQGILVPGGFGSRGVEGKIYAAKYARENKIPYLGICLGLQTALIEGVRNLLGDKKAHSEEFSHAKYDHVIIYMPETKDQQLGGTMQLGNRTTFIHPHSLAAKLYDQKPTVVERHRHRFEFNRHYEEALKAKGYLFSGANEHHSRIHIVEREDHPFFLGVQFHPEFTSKPHCAHPCFVGLVLAAAGKLEARLQAQGESLITGSGFSTPRDFESPARACKTLTKKAPETQEPVVACH